VNVFRQAPKPPEVSEQIEDIEVAFAEGNGKVEAFPHESGFIRSSERGFSWLWARLTPHRRIDEVLTVV